MRVIAADLRRCTARPGTSAGSARADRTGRDHLEWEDVEWSINHHMTDPKQLLDPRMSPVRAKNLSKLPPALLFTATPVRAAAPEHHDRAGGSEDTAPAVHTATGESVQKKIGYSHA